MAANDWYLSIPSRLFVIRKPCSIVTVSQKSEVYHSNAKTGDVPNLKSLIYTTINSLWV